MKGELTTNQIFLIIVFLIGLVVFIIGALWFKDYGIGVISGLPHLIPGLMVSLQGLNKRKQKGLSLPMAAVYLLLAVIFIAIMVGLSNAMGLF